MSWLVELPFVGRGKQSGQEKHKSLTSEYSQFNIPTVSIKVFLFPFKVLHKRRYFGLS